MDQDSKQEILLSDSNLKQQQERNLIEKIREFKLKKPITKWKKTWTLLWEMIGTAILAYGTCAAKSSAYVSMSLFAAILISFPFSGAHLNPAISLAFFIKREIGPFDLLFRCIGQIFGAVIGGFFSFIVLNKIQSPVMEGIDYTLRIQQDGEVNSDLDLYGSFTIYNAFAGEFFATFLFAVFILINTDPKTTLYIGQNKIITFVIIVLSYHFCRGFTQKTGGCLNPAVGTVLCFWNSLFTGESKYLKPIWIYIAAPFAGAFLGGIYYNWVHYPLSVRKDSELMDHYQFLKKQNKHMNQIATETEKKIKGDVELQNMDNKTPLRQDY